MEVLRLLSPMDRYTRQSRSWALRGARGCRWRIHVPSHLPSDVDNIAKRLTLVSGWTDGRGANYLQMSTSPLSTGWRERSDTLILNAKTVGACEIKDQSWYAHADKRNVRIQLPLIPENIVCNLAPSASTRQKNTFQGITMGSWLMINMCVFTTFHLLLTLNLLFKPVRPPQQKLVAHFHEMMTGSSITRTREINLCVHHFSSTFDIEPAIQTGQTSAAEAGGRGHYGPQSSPRLF